MSNHIPKYATIEKAVGETPLVTAERLRKKLNIPENIPLAYAGRLDPMASGKLLILIGDECKRQKEYHSFEKEYCIEILLGAQSDTGDVLGIIQSFPTPHITKSQAQSTLSSLKGRISLPYPHFSSKTVKGKPLHVWTLEGRLSEIEIPVQSSTIHQAHFNNLRFVSREEILQTIREKIETIPPVTDASKALGADFRRDEVRASWNAFEMTCPAQLPIINATFTATSGTYMRSLAQLIGEKLGSSGLAYSIHRTKIGRYAPLFGNIGFWTQKF